MVAVALPDVQRVFWWGADDREVDVVASADGRALVWADADECLRDARRQGWLVAGEVPTMLDLRPLVEWLRGHQLALDPSTALNAWNFAGDVAVAVGVPWADRGRLADACFDKLTIASVPWLAGRERYYPRWTSRQYTYLRRRMADAVGLIRAQLGPAEK